MKMAGEEAEIMFVAEDVDHGHLLLKTMKMDLTTPGRQTFEAKLMTK
jgi:hypothetical protein